MIMINIRVDDSIFAHTKYYKVLGIFFFSFIHSFTWIMVLVIHEKNGMEWNDRLCKSLLIQFLKTWIYFILIWLIGKQIRFFSKSKSTTTTTITIRTRKQNRKMFQVGSMCTLNTHTYTPTDNDDHQ